MILYLLIASIGVIGCAIGSHLLLTSKIFTGRLLGSYTLLITIVSVEPFTPHAPVFIISLLQVFIAVSSVMIGPVLFLYCKYTLLPVSWNKCDNWHFFPALVILILYVFSVKRENPDSETTEDVAFYVLFVIQLLGYSFVSLFMSIRKMRDDQTLRKKLNAVFLKPLVLASLILFLYSVIHTTVPFLWSNQFAIVIETMIGLVIVVIALLNAETLEKHSDHML